MNEDNRSWPVVQQLLPVIRLTFAAVIPRSEINFRTAKKYRSERHDVCIRSEHVALKTGPLDLTFMTSNLVRCMCLIGPFKPENETKLRTSVTF